MANESLGLSSEIVETPVIAISPEVVAKGPIITSDQTAQESKGDGHDQESTLTAVEQPINTNWHQRYQEAMRVQAELEEKLHLLLNPQQESLQNTLNAVHSALKAAIPGLNIVESDPQLSESFLQMNHAATTFRNKLVALEQALNTSLPLNARISKLIGDKSTPETLRNELSDLLKELTEKVEKELQTIEIFLDGQLALSRHILSEPIATSINPLRAHVSQILRMAQFPEGREIPLSDLTILRLIQEILEPNFDQSKLPLLDKILAPDFPPEKFAAIKDQARATFPGTPGQAPIPKDNEVETDDFESEAIMMALREHIANLSPERTESVDQGTIADSLRSALNGGSPDGWGRRTFKALGLNNTRGSNIAGGHILKISPQEAFIINWRLGRTQLPSHDADTDDKKKL